MKLFTALLMTMIVSTAEAAELNCELKEGIGRSPTGITQVDLERMTIHTRLRCYDTGDIWWDCDEIHEKVTLTDFGHADSYEGARVVLVVKKDDQSASLYVGGTLFFDLVCRLDKGDTK